MTASAVALLVADELNEVERQLSCCVRAPVYDRRCPRGDTKGRYMARALLGHISSGTDQVLALEITRLRRRVAALEAELVELREAHQPVAASLEVELHQLAESAAPALA